MTDLDIKRKASELLEKGRYDDAIAQYQDLLANSKKKNPAILNLIGDIQVKQGNLQVAFESYLEASRLYSEEELFHNGIAIGKKILRLDKEQIEVYGMLGNLYARQGLGIDAIKFLNEYTRRKEESDEFPAALAAFAEAGEILTDCPEIHAAHAGLLRKVGRDDDAASCFRKASQICADRGDMVGAERWSQELGDRAGEDDDSGVDNVADLMNLRTLDDDAPRSKVGRDGTDHFWGRQEQAPGLISGDLVDPAWIRYDPAQNPDLPPPPPLPGRAGAPNGGQPAPVEMQSTPDLGDALVEPPGLEEPAVVETPGRPEGTDSIEPPGLTLEVGGAEISDEAPSEPTIHEIKSESDGGGLELALEGLEIPSPEKAPGDVSLGELPGIVLPDSSPAPDAAMPAEPAVPEDTAAEPVVPADTPEEPVVPADTLEKPAVAADTPEEPAVAAGNAPSTTDQDLAAFFESASETPSNDQQAIVIGDDFELLREGGDVAEVIADFREATMEILDLDDHQAHYDLGTTYMEMELYDEAAAEFEMAARGEAWALPAQEMLGYCFLRKGQLDQAIRELEKGLNTAGYEESDKLGLLYNLGIAYGVLDEEQEAIASFQRILEIDADFRDTQMRLERLVQNSG